MNLLLLTGYAFITALATGLGALPFAFTKRVSPRWAAAAGAAAGGLMLAASAGLVREGFLYGAAATLGGMLLGGMLVHLLHRSTDGRPDVAEGLLGGLGGRRALVLFWVMFAHSFTEGVALGVSFGGGETLGLLVTLTMALHNIPEGLAIALSVVPRGVSWQKAALLAVVSSLPQPLMAVPAYLFVEAFRPMLPLGLGFAAGAMIWLSVTDLLPEAWRGFREASSGEALEVGAVPGGD